MVIGDTTDSCTTIIKKVMVDPKLISDFPHLNGHSVFLVDTPGFNRVEATNEETIRQIKAWFSSLPGHCELGGIIFLHDISNDRVIGANYLADATCKEFSPVSVVLGFTKGKSVLSQFEERVRILKDGYWRNIVSNGAIIEKIHSSDDIGGASAVLQTVLKTYISKCARRIVIPVVGMAGAGKSTLINTILETTDAVVGHDQAICTRRIREHTNRNLFWYHRSCIIHSVVLVDTPGFDNPVVSDTTVRRQIEEHVGNLSAPECDFGGVIYVQDLTSDYDWRNALHNLLISKRNIQENVAIVATKGGRWGNNVELTQRLESLKKYQCKYLILQNCQVFEIGSTLHPPIEARRIVDAVLERYKPTTKVSSVEADTSLRTWFANLLRITYSN
uniref:G domain-containing protein n=1 Tax=Psilocybe cubensis TaxID=181762 RepID=A0A8H8CPY9_PSICU